MEFENDLIASTDDMIFTNKQIMRYENDYFHEPPENPRQPRDPLSRHTIRRISESLYSFLAGGGP
jgi:hypothetical protein